MNENPLICSKCQGACCKRLPGTTDPRDLGLPSLMEVTQLLYSGRWTVDWWEGDPRFDDWEDHEVSSAKFLRPAIKGREGRLRDPAYGGECTFLTPTGCELPPEKRPKECRLLTPEEGFQCKLEGWGKKESAIAWLPYNKALERLLEELSGF